MYDEEEEEEDAFELPSQPTEPETDQTELDTFVWSPGTQVRQALLWRRTALRIFYADVDPDTAWVCQRQRHARKLQVLRLM